MKTANDSETRLKFKHIRKPKYESLFGHTFWICFGKNAPMSGNMLIAKAKTLALQIRFKRILISPQSLKNINEIVDLHELSSDE